MSGGPEQIAAGDFCVEHGCVGDPGGVGDEGDGGGAINFSGCVDVGENGSLQGNGVSNGSDEAMFAEEKLRPFRIRDKLRDPKFKRGAAMAGGGGAPHAPS